MINKYLIIFITITPQHIQSSSIQAYYYPSTFLQLHVFTKFHQVHKSSSFTNAYIHQTHIQI